MFDYMWFTEMYIYLKNERRLKLVQLLRIMFILAYINI